MLSLSCVHMLYLSCVQVFSSVCATCEWYVEPELRVNDVFELRANVEFCLCYVWMICCFWATCEWYVEPELRVNYVFELRANVEFCLCYVRMICCFWAARKRWLFFSYVQIICWLSCVQMTYLSCVQMLSSAWATCELYVVFKLRAKDMLSLSCVQMMYLSCVQMLISVCATREW